MYPQYPLFNELEKLGPKEGDSVKIVGEPVNTDLHND